MVFAADYPFLDVVWSMVVFFAFVIWVWMLVAILTDVFRRRDTSGWTKAAWTVFLIVLPFLGVLIYLIANNDGMTQRGLEREKAIAARYDDRLPSSAHNGDSAVAEITAAKGLLDSGAINQPEFDALKARALAHG